MTTQLAPDGCQQPQLAFTAAAWYMPVLLHTDHSCIVHPSLPAVMGSRVMACDLQPACFHDVQRMLLQNNVVPGVRLRNLGLWNGTGSLKLSSTDTCSPYTSVASKSTTTLSVQLGTLDKELEGFFEQFPPSDGDLRSITLLKIDAEGAEIPILEVIIHKQ